MAHAASGRRGRARDEGRHRLLHVLLDVGGGVFLAGAADFADENDRVGIRVFVEHPDRVGVRRAVDRVAADADAGALAETARGELPNRLVGQRAAARDNADLAGLVDVAGHDAYLALAGRDDAGTVRPNQPHLLVAQADLGPHHVDNRDALGDTNNQFDARIGRFKNRVSRAGRRDEDHRGVATGFLARFPRRVEDGNLALPRFAATAGRDAGDDVRAVLGALFGVESAGFASDALHKQARVLVNEDGHK